MRRLPPAPAALLAALVVCATTSTPLAAAPLEVRLLSRVEGTTRPTPEEKRVRLGTAVELVADVRGPLRIDGAKAPADCTELARTLPAARARCEVAWFKVEPIDHSLSNTEPTFHWAPIRYRETPIPACRDRLRCRADVRTTVLHDHGGLGTMAFRVRVALGPHEGASPGAEKLHRGGLRPEVARVTVRRDDTYLGWLTELYNTPYIWGSAGDDAVHQAERRIGSDCADFVTYGVRRLGHALPYTSSYGLAKYVRTLHRSPGPGADGLIRDANGRPIPVGPDGVRPGDLLRFPGHVGVFVRDEPPLGVLSVSDVMAHTSWREPVEESIGRSDYRAQRVEVARWKVLDR